LIGPTCCEPETFLLPDHEPDAVQLVTFAELHVSVVLPFAGTPGGDAEI
jgi:hypothetical protein